MFILDGDFDIVDYIVIVVFLGMMVLILVVVVFFLWWVWNRFEMGINNNMRGWVSISF